MEKINKNLTNQALGLLPLLLFMAIDTHLSYLLSFAIGISFCFVSIFSYKLLRKENQFQFLLIPSGVTLILYSMFLCFRLEPLLFIYSPLIVEILFVIVLTLAVFFKRYICKVIYGGNIPSRKKGAMKASLNESFFMAQLVQNLFTLHLFVVLIYNFLPEAIQSEQIEHILFRQTGFVIGLGVIGYEQIRVMLMRGQLKKETWLPVLNDQGTVVGCIARSVSRSLPKKYFHPVVRVAIVHKGMLYLTTRREHSYVCPGMMDYPYYSYVLFKKSLEGTVKEIVKHDIQKKSQINPRHMLRYTFENENVKHLVNLYVMIIRSEKVMDQIKRENGKLWTAKQIEENIGSGLFSDYFEQEFEYLQHTVLLAESLMVEQTAIAQN